MYSKFRSVPSLVIGKRQSDVQKVIIACELCSYETNRKSNYDRHMKSMHEKFDKPLLCCGQSFLNKADLKRHGKDKHETGYECEICEKSFPRKALLRRHEAVHSGIKDFSCPNCAYETSHKSNLERHCTRVHNIDIPKKKKGSAKDISPAHPRAGSRQSSTRSSNDSESESTESEELFQPPRVFSTPSPSDCSLDSIEFKADPVKKEQAIQEILPPFNPYDDLHTDDQLSYSYRSDTKRLRLCLHPYKCQICYILFESQTEFLQHLCPLPDNTELSAEQKECLDIFKAAAALTLYSRSGAKITMNT